jgi:hypothetical protein
VMDVQAAFAAVGLVSIAIVLVCLPVIRRAAQEDGPASAGPSTPEVAKPELAGAAALAPFGIYHP